MIFKSSAANYSTTFRLTILLFFLASFLAALGDNALQPVHLTCEYQKNPLGIDIEKPRLSWNFIAIERNQSQTAYEIIAGDNEKDINDAKGNVWQSGKIVSSENIQIVYEGKALQPFTKYFWRVKVYDKNGAASD